MPYDEKGNYVSDIGEYLRRARLQGALVPSPGAPQEQTDNYQPPAFVPPQPGPEESAYKQLLHQEPKYSDYHPSGLRRALGTLAGAVSGNPDVRKGIIEGPYQKKLTGYQQQLGTQKAAATAETDEAKNAATQEHLHYQGVAESERAGAEHARKLHEQYDIGPLAHTRKMEELAVQHPGGAGVFHEARLKDNSLVSLKRDPATGKLINVDTGTQVGMGAIDVLSDPNKSLKETKEANMPAALAGSIKARQIIAEPDKYDQPTVDAAKEFIAQLEAGKPPTAAFASIVAKRNAERKANNQPEMSSAELETLETKLLSIQKPPQALLMPPGGGEAMAVKPGTVVPPGMVTPQQAGSEQVAADKNLRDALKARKDLEKTYQMSINLAATPSATNDLALMFQFLGAIKPEALGKLRLNNNEINLVEGTRSLLGDVEAKMAKIRAGELLTPQQRQSMIDTMKTLAGMEDEATPQGPANHAVPKVGEMINGKRITKITEIHK